jgi:hypothetical protein
MSVSKYGTSLSRTSPPTLPGKVLWYCGGLLLFYLALHSYPAMAAASDAQQLSLQYSL